MTREIWRSVGGYSDTFVSNMGRALRFKFSSRDGGVGSELDFKLLKGSPTGTPNRHGVRRRRIDFKKDGKWRGRTKSHLVLELFVGPRPFGYLACQVNDDPLDDRLDNLYWGTHEDNAADARRNRLKEKEAEKNELATLPVTFDSDLIGNVVILETF